MSLFHTHPLLASHPTIAHGFFGREGGVSTGIYTSLNCGPGSRDAPDAVRENRRRVSAAMGFEATHLCSLYQDHTADAMVVRTPLGDERPRVDGFATNIPGILLGILAADCAPVLFADASAGVVAAAHAGWKGSFTGIIENTVVAMEALGAKRQNIQAVVGPCIAQPSYEVGPEFVARLVEADAANAQYFESARHPGAGRDLQQKELLLREIPGLARDDSQQKLQFNLPAYVLMRCGQAGLRNAEWIGMDTRPDNSPFFSYRRKTINGEADYGRQISVIGLKE
ncbi:MAG: polyphenol oxidase family protein [Rickettsiales bacterium]